MTLNSYSFHNTKYLLFTIHSSALAPAWSGPEDGQGLWFHGVFGLIGTYVPCAVINSFPCIVSFNLPTNIHSLQISKLRSKIFWPRPDRKWQTKSAPRQNSNCWPFIVNHHSVETILGKHDGDPWAGERGRWGGGAQEREQGETPGLDYRVDTSSEGDGSQRC